MEHPKQPSATDAPFHPTTIPHQTQSRGGSAWVVSTLPGAITHTHAMNKAEGAQEIAERGTQRCARFSASYR